MKNKKPPLRVRVAVVLLSVVFALLVFEVFLRATGYSYQTFYRPDDALGYTLEPGAEGWHKKEGRSYVRVNSDGLRDREYAKPKPPNTFRVAVVGDSYAEALQVAEEDGFTSVLERRLPSCPALAGRAVEVVNFGVSGYSTAQELLTLRRKVWAYEPDLVLLMVTTNNDVTDNVRAFKEADDIPYMLLRGDELVPDDSFRDSAKFRFRTSVLARAGRWLYSNLRFVHAVQQARHTFKARLAQWRDRRLAEAERERREAAARATHHLAAPLAASAQGEQQAIARSDLANMVYVEPQDEGWREAWRLMERLLVEMRREVEARGARFVVVTGSNPIQVYPDPAARAAFLARLGPGADLLYPDRRFAEFGRREGLTLFTLAPELQAYADREKVFLHGWPGDLGNGHWNEQGHRLAGELLTQKLCDYLTQGGGANAQGGTTR
ncbi:MAG: SGNH/GDSL hydrolase family protein [Pyrinomonadaceae bacterium]